MKTVVPLRKILALCTIAALLSLRLSNLTEQVFVEPVEDAIFHNAFIAAEECGANGKRIKVAMKRACDLLLAPVEAPLPSAERPIPATTPAIAAPVPKEIRADIFIPPERLS